MVFETYGNYVDGLEQDTLQILEYFGRDFIESKIKNPGMQLNGSNFSLHSAFLPPETPRSTAKTKKKQTPGNTIKNFLVKVLVKVRGQHVTY